MKAISAYEKALEWRQLFDLATREDFPEDEIVEMGYRVAGSPMILMENSLTYLPALNTERLSLKKRYHESARILLDYCKDVREAVVALVQGNDFAEARRIVRLCYTPVCHV